MRFVRAHQTFGAWLALAALLVQFVFHSPTFTAMTSFRLRPRVC
jgi:hypothetical protein